MLDRGFFLTWQAIRRQLAAMPHNLYLVRLIHHATRRAFPGERLWNATLLASAATIGFLRRRNGEGCDIYLHPSPRIGTQATFCSISTQPNRPCWKPCAVMDSSLVLCFKPALAICKPGCTSADSRWSQLWPQPSP